MHWLVVGESQLPRGLDWLSQREATRLAGMRFTKRRNEYLLRRWAGKVAVATLAGRRTDPASLRGVEVLNRATGAPEVWLGGRPCGLQVSLTDRAGWAVCLVDEASGSAGSVGVDLELVEPRSAGFVQDFLTPAEQRDVNSRPDEQERHAAANLIWSAKESALKVLQTGLRADTRDVEVTVAREPDGAGWMPLRVRARGDLALLGRVDARTVTGDPAGGDPVTGDPAGGDPVPGGRMLPGWWRRDGVFLLTLACERALPPPVPLDGSADLATAVPVHSWLSDPLPP